MLPAQVQQAVNRLLELFESGDVPQALAHATYPRLKVPSVCWSFLNRLLMLLQGTEDARGFRQWREAGRSVKRGAKAIHILAPVYREYVLCPDRVCKARYFLRKDEEQPGVCALCGASLAEERPRQLIQGFHDIPDHVIDALAEAFESEEERRQARWFDGRPVFPRPRAERFKCITQFIRLYNPR